MAWQTANLAPSNAELLIATTLRSLLVGAGETAVYVDRSIPNPRRTRMVVVNRDGGAFDGVFDHPRIRVRVWDASPLASTDLARLVTRLMLQMPGASGVTDVAHQSGPYEVADASGQPQMYLLFNVTIRGVAE